MASSVFWVFKAGVGRGVSAVAPTAAAARINATAGYATTTTTSEPGRRQTMGKVSGDVSKTPNLTSMKRGPGYRSSFSGSVATVFGASGSVGACVCNRLGKNGTQMIIPYRGDHYDVLRLKVCGDLGQVLFTPYHLMDEDSLRKAMKYSDVVINLIGREFETKNFSFEEVNVNGPARIARIARECGVKTLVHISAINARENPKTLFTQNGSNFLRTKWLGEKAVLEQFPDATIFRPADMYGSNDYLVSYYNHWTRSGYKNSRIPLWKKGNYTIRAPLHMSNLADGIMAALDAPEAKGQIFDAPGPDRFLLADLVDWMFEVMYKDPVDWMYRRVDLRVDISPFIKAFFLQKMPLGLRSWRSPTIDKLERSQLNEEPEGFPTLEDLGVKLNKVQDEMPWVLDPFRAYRFHTYYSLADRPVIHPLKPLSFREEAAILQEEKQANLLTSLF